ncbi:hypothetical protein SAMN02745121_08884 [Nannocystis exedens]|uniref:Response regulatory domain-containing protein n=2 Tax=Nannocystis exedens TaxID=54 RepID=A0A1I2IPX0_9BACT|nr:hypothetical protein NAEX_02130 [Nannocystis exedens]SFF44314.1 hypothetical protein SAMN02745121_08884 [Nannocystis exedens]
MDGDAVARALRADEELRRSTLVAPTGYAQPDDATMARSAGFDAHLAKPVSMEALEQVLAGVPRTTAASRCMNQGPCLGNASRGLASRRSSRA